uniref:F-box family protein n=1 Tax=Marseillevirus LCMAC201 TaxID=2506605 RepID=A0A481YWA1_9VIRU|nr:MAG: F-box family protein [Marseillevirus LCMAC201]
MRADAPEFVPGMYRVRTSTVLTPDEVSFIESLSKKTQCSVTPELVTHHETILAFPNEIICHIGLFLPLSAVSACSRTTKRLNEVLSANNYYWRCRYEQDFGAKENIFHCEPKKIKR